MCIKPLRGDIVWIEMNQLQFHDMFIKLQLTVRYNKNKYPNSSLSKTSPLLKLKTILKF